MKSGAPFFRIDIIYMIYFAVKYFSVVCLSIYYEKLAVNCTYDDGKEVKFLSVRHNLKCICVKMLVFETHFKIFNSCFLYIQHIIRRNKFTPFKPWKLEILTLLTVKENLYMNLLRTRRFFSYFMSGGHIF